MVRAHQHTLKQLTASPASGRALCTGPSLGLVPHRETAKSCRKSREPGQGPWGASYVNQRSLQGDVSRTQVRNVRDMAPLIQDLCSEGTQSFKAPCVRVRVSDRRLLCNYNSTIIMFCCANRQSKRSGFWESGCPANAIRSDRVNFVTGINPQSRTTLCLMADTYGVSVSRGLYL